MAAVILEVGPRQVEERRDLAMEKERALGALFRDLSAVLDGKELPELPGVEQEARLCRLIEGLYAEKDRLGPEVFAAANRGIRGGLRKLLDEELKAAGKTGQ